MGTPTVKSGAETMKIINRTSITSTMGVTLISLITPWRRRRRWPLCAIPFIAIGPPSPALVDLPRQDRGKFVGKTLQALRLFIHLGRELVVENRRRDGGNKADRRCEQRLGDARRHHRERGILGSGDRLKAGHDAPDRAEQADKGTGRTDR